MNNWKDTARTSNKIKRKYANSEKVVLSENALVIIEKELADGLFLVVDTNPDKSQRRTYKLKASEIVIEEYSITRDLNIQTLLSDGWDSKELLKHS